MKKVSETINDLMPTGFNKEDEFYKAFIADTDTDSGALTNEVKDVTDFINYYTKFQKIEDAHTSMLESIVKAFPGLIRRRAEPDEYLRLRFKSFMERKRSTRWNSAISIKDVFSYFFPQKDIYLIEQYPVNNLIQNGGFDTLDSWIYNNADTEFKLIYSRSFEDGSAMYINPSVANSAGYMEQLIPAVPAGFYDFLFFFSSSKKGIGDVQFSIRNGTGQYWNGASWSSAVYNFYEKADDDTVGYYKPVQKNVNITATSSITIRFKNVNGNGVLIDSARFGKISEPTFRVFITAEPDLFLDGSFKLNKQYNLSGFKDWYIHADMDEILRKIKPAGVYAEMSVLASRLNIPWDRVLLRWETNIKTYWHWLLDGSKSLNSGGIRYEYLYLNNEINLDSKQYLDGLKMVRYSKPGDLLLGPPMFSHIKTLKRKTSVRTKRKLYLDGRIGLNGKFNLAGEVIGVTVGYSYMRVTKFVTKTLTGQAVLDGVMFKLNSEIKLNEKYTYQQNGTETYFVKEVS